jgi:hypothetical protein
VKAALRADSKYRKGEYPPDDPPITGLKAAARVYAGAVLELLGFLKLLGLLIKRTAFPAVL